MGTWYKDFYLATPAGEQQMRDAFTDPDHGAQNRADVERRLAEMRQIPDDRCHITKKQRDFLERVLGAQ